MDRVVARCSSAAARLSRDILLAKPGGTASESDPPSISDDDGRMCAPPPPTPPADILPRECDRAPPPAAK